MQITLILIFCMPRCCNQFLNGIMPELFTIGSIRRRSVFEYANKEMGEPVYDVHLLSEKGGSIRSSIGVSVATGRLLRALRRPLQLPFNDLCPFWALIIGENRLGGIDFSQADLTAAHCPYGRRQSAGPLAEGRPAKSRFAVWPASRKFSIVPVGPGSPPRLSSPSGLMEAHWSAGHL